MCFRCIFTSETSGVLGDHARLTFLPSIFREGEMERAPNKPRERFFLLSGNSLLYQRGRPLGLLHGFQGDRDTMPAFPVPFGPTYNSHTRQLARLQIKK